MPISDDVSTQRKQNDVHFSYYLFSWNIFTLFFFLINNLLYDLNLCKWNFYLAMYPANHRLTQQLMSTLKIGLQGAMFKIVVFANFKLL